MIFLHREFSLLPYSRHFSHSKDCFLDFLCESPDGSGEVVVDPQYRDKTARVLRKYNAAKESNCLLMLPFVTITDYLFELRAVAQLMQPLGPKGLLYLAAAVSDFFLPPDRMAEHKIQSTDAADGLGQGDQGAATAAVAAATAAAEEGSSIDPAEEEETFDNFDSSPRVPRSKRLVIDLDPVPKFLHNLVADWSPGCYIVSFKLETDPTILVHKAKYSLDRYQHNLVIGNLLSTRKWEVVFVTPNAPDRWVRVPISRRKKTISGVEGLVGAADEAFGEDKPIDPKLLPPGEPEMEIESLIIPAVEELHLKHIEAYGKGGTA